MSKTWKASVTIDLGVLSAKDIPAASDYFKKFFKDVNNPTDQEVKRYFERIVENYAGSNDGSEILANTPVDITLVES